MNRTRALAVTWATWRVARRDLASIVVFVIALPVAVAALLGSIYTAVDGRTQRVGVVAEGDGPVSARLIASLSAAPTLRAESYSSLADALHDVRTRELDGVVAIPAAVDNPAIAPATLVRLYGAPGIAAPSGLRAEVELAVADTAARVIVGRSLAPDDPLGDGLVEADKRARAAAVDVVPSGDSSRTLELRSFAVLGAMVLFVFMNTLASSSQLSSLREQGVLARLRTTPMRSWHTVFGFAAYLAAFGVVQGLLMTVVGTAALGLHWEDPVALVVVVVAVGIAAGCLASCVGTFLPSWPTGAAAGGALGFVGGMLGGCLWSLSLVGPVMRTVGHVTPQAWALDAFDGVVHADALSDIARPVAALAAMSLAFAAVAVMRMHRSVSAATS